MSVRATSGGKWKRCLQRSLMMLENGEGAGETEAVLGWWKTGHLGPCFGRPGRVVRGVYSYSCISSRIHQMDDSVKNIFYYFCIMRGGSPGRQGNAGGTCSLRAGACPRTKLSQRPVGSTGLKVRISSREVASANYCRES